VRNLCHASGRAGESDRGSEAGLPSLTSVSVGLLPAVKTRSPPSLISGTS
jgi:hypothetical protein